MSASFEPIVTSRLLLRVFEKADLEAMTGYMVAWDVQRYLGQPIRDRAECKSALDGLRRQVALKRPGDAVAFAVVRLADDRLLGQVTLRWQDATAAQAELGFVFNPVYRKDGLVSEALGAALERGFRAYKFHRIYARCAAHHQNSANLLAQLGMRLEAHYREHAMFQGEWDEELVFAILNREWGRSAKVHDLSVHKVA